MVENFDPRAFVGSLTHRPGVYRMLNAKSEVLYVGKAASLKKRVASYAKPSNQSYRIMRMISETTEMIFISTASETEALLLEANLSIPEDLGTWGSGNFAAHGSHDARGREHRACEARPLAGLAYVRPSS